MFSKEELNKFYRYCIVLTGEENSASDLLQCCLEKYVRQDTAGVCNLKAYFRRMIRNQFFNDQRKDENQHQYKFDEECIAIQIDTKSLDDIIIEREQVELILKMLTPHEREILFLWAVEGLTVQDISHDLGIPKGTLLSRLDFPLIDSARVPRDAWELIGGRYCFLKGQFAAQLKLQNKMNRKIYTLYQLEKPTDITGVSGFPENFVNGVKVNLWIERGLVIALAGES